jgi:murein DD-endopeptidase MepM/ murein hydrolase activator NlpD
MRLSQIRSDSDRMMVRYRPNEDGGARVLSLYIIRSPIHRIRAQRVGDGFEVQEIHASTSTSLSRATGTIERGMSFTEAALTAGVPHSVIVRFHDIFSFDVDFVREIHPNDRFAIMFERVHAEDGTFLGAGDLLYAELFLNSRRRTMTLYRYETEKGIVGYFDENGNSATKTLKKTPINGARISSRYGMRRHPVLGFSREHRGVDFAAPHGTPIPAGGAGTIARRGFDRNGYGNYIVIRHNSTYSTLYAHMSRFASGMNVGARVNQGQIIGFVGSTGVSTGPHLHYEIHRNGIAVNPLTINLPPAITLSKAELVRFADARDRLNTQFAALDRPFSPIASRLARK